MTNSNPVTALQRFGQSVWLDDLRRSLFTSGKFGRLIAEDGLRGDVQPVDFRKGDRRHD
jgi:transaldolase / glucose-6-phosphate isomerase